MALTWVDGNLINGDFETGDLTGWTVEKGDPQVKIGTPTPPETSGPDDLIVYDGGQAVYFVTATELGTHFAGGNLGSSILVDQISQEITIPADALMVELTGIVGCNKFESIKDTDRGAAWVRFENSAGEYVGGCFYTTTNVVEEVYESFRIFSVIPAGAIRAFVVGTFARSSISWPQNNGLVTGLAARWVTGPEEDMQFGGNELFNEYFQTGDLSFWEQITAEAPGLSTNLLYVNKGSRAVVGRTHKNTAIQQTVPVPVLPSASHGLVTGWLSGGAYEQHDLSEIFLTYINSSGDIIRRTGIAGPSNEIAQRQISIFDKIPSGAVSALVEIRFGYSVAQYYESGADNLTFQWVTMPDVSPGATVDAFTYQWAEETGGILPGETEQKLSFTASIADDGNRYYCDVTGDGGTTPSYAALLTVVPVGSMVLSGPEDVTIPPDTLASFFVSVSGGEGPYSYEWHEVGSGAIIGTNSSYSFIASLEDSGRQFYVIVSDSGSLQETSRTALLTVVAEIPPEPPKEWPDPEVWPPDYECDIFMPCCLPAPLVAGHGYESSSRVRRNNLVSGPPIYTLEDDDGYELFNVSWSFNNVETQIFRNFYRYTIASGSKEFCIDLMVDGWNGTKRTKTHRVYFEGQPQYSLHGLRWNVSATLLAIQEQINDECDGLLLAEAYCVFTSGLAWAMADLHDIVENVLWEAP